MENLAATPEMAYYCFEVLEHELAITKNGEGNKKRKGAPLAAPDPYAYNIPDDFEWFALPLDYVLALNNIKSLSTCICSPLFVGWKKSSKDGSDERLRGCKGTHGTLPLHEGLRQYALLRYVVASHRITRPHVAPGSRCAHRDTPTLACDRSAFDDSRFRPVTEDEVPRLACTVNLLFAFEKCDDCFDWEVLLTPCGLVLCALVFNTSCACRVCRLSCAC
jgi:hypothetical protein